MRVDVVVLLAVLHLLALKQTEKVNSIHQPAGLSKLNCRPAERIAHRRVSRLSSMGHLEGNDDFEQCAGGCRRGGGWRRRRCRCRRRNELLVT